ncbi:mucin-like protein 3 [Diceros bicornis minor]|uniref:mucin-like protein 3 n=1 Tax=Diceros bicornis minor TaxID=77932 RepID=UPI0026EB8A27|nr:mucin-like protein 3 [Diceros bicornis minor]
MALLDHCIRSILGLQCCLLFLLASREAGATIVQELQKTGESPTSDHLLPPTPHPINTTPSDHTALHSGYSPSDLPKSTETQKPKHRCNTTHRSKPTNKPIDNSGSSTTPHEAPTTSEQKPSNQGKDQIVRNERSADSTNSPNTHTGSLKYSTPAPKSKTTCHKSKTSQPTVTRNSAKTITTNIITLVSESTTSHKTTNPSHNSLSSETKKTPTSTSEKSTTARSTPYQATGIPKRSERDEDHTTAADYRTTVESDKKPIKTTENIKETTSATEKTQTPAKPTEQGQETTAAHENTRAPAKPMEQQQETTGAHEKTTRAPEKPTEQRQETTVTTSATETIKPTENPAKNTAATETIRPPVKVTGDKSITNTSPRPNKTEVTYQVPIGSFTATTSSMELSSIISEAPGNQSHPNQNKDDSEGGLNTGESGEDSFPSWAIVIVILLAVILLLVFFGLIFLVSYMMRTRRALIRNPEDNDPENDVGPNSYPVYLMEQQTLGTSQIPSPR